MKTRSDPLSVVCLVGCERLLCERIRASLRRGPFHFTEAPDLAAAGDADLCLLPARAIEELHGGLPPVIACGPAALLRGAFLAGCSDYLRDPWTPEELSLRALAVIGRAARRFRFPGGEITLRGQTLGGPAGAVHLSPHQARLLGLLLRARGNVVPRAALSYAIWGRQQKAASRAVDVHVSAIRRRLRSIAPPAGALLRSVRGEGYLIE